MNGDEPAWSVVGKPVPKNLWDPTISLLATPRDLITACSLAITLASHHQHRHTQVLGSGKANRRFCGYDDDQPFPPMLVHDVVHKSLAGSNGSNEVGRDGVGNPP